MTFTVFLFAWKLFSYTATDLISPVGNGHRKLFVGGKKNQTTSWKKKEREKLSDIPGVKQLKNTLSFHPHREQQLED